MADTSGLTRTVDELSTPGGHLRWWRGFGQHHAGVLERYAEEIVLLTETEIEESIRLLFEQHRLVVEGSGALGAGGLLE